MRKVYGLLILLSCINIVYVLCAENRMNEMQKYFETVNNASYEKIKALEKENRLIKTDIQKLESVIYRGEYGM